LTRTLDALTLAGMTIAAAIYARISEDREGRALGVGRQVGDCRALIERRGWTVAGEYTDNDLSAYTGRVRPAYRRLLDDVRSSRVEAIVAWHPDRLHRSPRELEEFIEIVEGAGIPVETVTAGDIDLTTPSGRVVARTLGAMARYESEHKSERIRRKHAELAAAGRPVGGGTRPFGFEADRVTVRADEATLIREAAGRVLAGDSLRGICADWNRRGIVTPTGGRWMQQPLRRLLMSPRIAGWREHAGAMVARAVWPAIIDRDTLDRLRAVLSDPRRRKAAIVPRAYLLSGFLRCGLCDKPLRARPRGDKVRRYVCASGPMFAGCGKVAILAEPLEDQVTAEVIRAIDSPELAALRGREATEDADILARIREDEAALEQLARDHYVDRVIGRAEFVAARTALDDRLSRSRTSLADRARDVLSGTVSSGLAAEWRTLDLDRRRAIIDAVIESITMGAGRRGLNRYDPSRVSIAWRA